MTARWGIEGQAMEYRVGMRYMLVWCGLLFTPGAFAQGGVAALPGTYQLYSVEPKIPEVFTTDLRLFMEDHRAQDHDVVLRVGRVTWVKILARITINEPGFVPLPEDILPVEPGSMPDIPVTR